MVSASTSGVSASTTELLILLGAGYLLLKGAEGKINEIVSIPENVISRGFDWLNSPITAPIIPSTSGTPTILFSPFQAISDALGSFMAPTAPSLPSLPTYANPYDSYVTPLIQQGMFSGWGLNVHG